jgi:hypothetical protein
LLWREIVDITHYQKLALPNGLVIMQIDQPLAPYKVGGYAGFSPDEAMFYHKEGIAHPKDGPIDYPKQPPPAPPPAPALVEIPKAWRQLNRLQKAHIVAAIHGTALTPSITTKECDHAIETELARREAKETPPIVTTQSLPRQG